MESSSPIPKFPFGGSGSSGAATGKKGGPVQTRFAFYQAGGEDFLASPPPPQQQEEGTGEENESGSASATATAPTLGVSGAAAGPSGAGGAAAGGNNLSGSVAEAVLPASSSASGELAGGDEDGDKSKENSPATNREIVASNKKIAKLSTTTSTTTTAAPTKPISKPPAIPPSNNPMMPRQQQHGVGGSGAAGGSGISGGSRNKMTFSFYQPTAAATATADVDLGDRTGGREAATAATSTTETAPPAAAVEGREDATAAAFPAPARTKAVPNFSSGGGGEREHRPFPRRLDEDDDDHDDDQDGDSLLMDESDEEEGESAADILRSLEETPKHRNVRPGGGGGGEGSSVSSMSGGGLVDASFETAATSTPGRAEGTEEAEAQEEECPSSPRVSEQQQEEECSDALTNGVASTVVDRSASARAVAAAAAAAAAKDDDDDDDDDGKKYAAAAAAAHNVDDNDHENPILLEGAIHDALNLIRRRTAERHSRQQLQRQTQHRHQQDEGIAYDPAAGAGAGAGAVQTPIKRAPQDEQQQVCLLQPATPTQTQLLSPPADVRKLVSANCHDLFRNPPVDVGDPSVAVGLQTPVGLPSRRIGLAEPVMSAAPTPNNVATTPREKGGGEGLGREQQQQQHQEEELAAGRGGELERRRQQQQQEQEEEERWRREEEVERGVELVLSAILDRTKGGGGVRGGGRSIEDALSSLFAQSQQSSSPSLSPTLPSSSAPGPDGRLHRPSRRISVEVGGSCDEEEDGNNDDFAKRLLVAEEDAATTSDEIVEGGGGGDDGDGDEKGVDGGKKVVRASADDKRASVAEQLLAETDDEGGDGTTATATTVATKTATTNGDKEDGGSANEPHSLVATSPTAAHRGENSGGGSPSSTRVESATSPREDEDDDGLAGAAGTASASAKKDATRSGGKKKKKKKALSLVPYDSDEDGFVGVEAIQALDTSIVSSAGGEEEDGGGGCGCGGGGGEEESSTVAPLRSLAPLEGGLGGRSSSGRVLGRLSKKMGGTTGVVLSDDRHHHDDETSSGSACGLDGLLDGLALGHMAPAPPISPVVAKDGRYVLNDGAAAPGTPVSPSLIQSLSDTFKITAGLGGTPEAAEEEDDDGGDGGDEDGNEDRSEVDDVHDDVDESTIEEDRRGGASGVADKDAARKMEAEKSNALMRTLCAHLLPYGVDEKPPMQPTTSSSSSSSPSKAGKAASEVVESLGSWFSGGGGDVGSLDVDSDDDNDDNSSRGEGSARGGDCPSWDEADPDEPGYVVHRLSKGQLRGVEREFENMINRVRQSSERRLMGDDGHRGVGPAAARIRSSDAKGGGGGRFQGQGSAAEGDVSDDEEFERDLEEAEELLDREERRVQAEEKAAKAASGRREAPSPVESMVDDTDSDDDSSSASDSSESESESSGSSVSSATDDSEVMAQPAAGNQDLQELAGARTTPAHLLGNPDFPTVYPSGKGKMGDLELFHLPIIYKSNQTGFEPTKDLVLQAGAVFAGQYLVQNELGSAAFSTAYRCIDLNSGKRDDEGEEYHEEVCLKVIKNTKDFFDQSLDEIKVLELLRRTGRCDENCIVEMKTFFYHREHLVIVTELLRQNLYEFGKFIVENDEPPYFTRQRLSYITRQTLIALSFIHNLGLVHSDVKPENILLSSYSKAKVKLIDFGSSCYLSDRQSSYIQSRSYRAPEVILGLPYDGKIDIWSLGCVVAEMYTGQVTFQNDSIVSMLSRIEAVCGSFPRHLIANGRQSGQFFTASGLLYEKDEADDNSERRSSVGLDTDDERSSSSQDEEHFNIFQPKATTMAARLGFAADLMEKNRSTLEEEERAMFVDFLRSLLTIDPDSRPTADEALNHPWILSGFNLSEKDISYPPE